METALAERKQSGSMVEIATSRQAQEVQAAMVIAQRYPRDVNKAYSRVMEDCKRRSLAEKAVYSYPRAGGKVTGPSIRLAETVAKAYGNLDFGVIELDKKSAQGNIPGESTMMAYCWDLETNTRSTKIFTVAHTRDKNEANANGKTKIKVALTDERDIYEIAANNGARRLRACILSIVPTDIVESALEACKKTMLGGQGPLVDRLRQMIVAFKDFGVVQPMVEKYLGHTLETTTEDELVELRTVYTSLKDGVADRSDFFEIPKESGRDVTEIVASAMPVDKTMGKPKNFAPQSKEEAEKQAAEIMGRVPAEEPKFPAEGVDDAAAKARRDNLVKTLIGFQKALKLTNPQFTDEIFNLTQKKTRDLSEDEISDLCAIFEARVQKLEGEQPNV